MLKHGILGLLNYGKMTGYEIMTVFRDSLSFFWHAQTSQIYRELQTLEKSGWIQSTRIEQESRPDKNMLSITRDGKKELLRWLRDDDVKSTVRSPLMMKTFFRGECSIDENIEFFKNLPEQKSVFPEGSKKADLLRDEYQKNVADKMKALYWKFTMDFGLMYEKMLRKWCKDCIRELEEYKHGNTAD
ncbi:MAG: PadR family transcriptional regulator [Treponema sp.]|nr:PadR family transcriptional regulator [Treponema sp.]